MPFLIWFGTTFFLAPLALNLAAPLIRKGDHGQKALLCAVLCLVEFYVVLGGGSPESDSSGFTISYSAGARQALAFPVAFVSMGILGPIICKFPFGVGWKVAAWYTGMKFVAYGFLIGFGR